MQTILYEILDKSFRSSSITTDIFNYSYGLKINIERREVLGVFGGNRF